MANFIEWASARPGNYSHMPRNNGGDEQNSRQKDGSSKAAILTIYRISPFSIASIQMCILHIQRAPRKFGHSTWGGKNAETRRRWPNISVTCWGLGYVCIDPRGKLDKTSASPPGFIPPVSWRRTIHLTSSYTALWRHRVSTRCILQARGQSNFNFLHSTSAQRLVPRWTRMGDLQWTYSRFIDPKTLFESYPPTNHVSCLWHCQTERSHFVLTQVTESTGYCRFLWLVVPAHRSVFNG